MNKEEIFKREISYLTEDIYKEDAKTLVNILPDYFYHIAASSTGKYHPAYACGEGGLLRHTKAAVRIAHELLNDPLVGDKYTSREKDLMLVGLMIHDGFKLGINEERYTRVDHPLVVCNQIRKNKELLKMSEEDIDFLCNVIESHMGIWNKDFDGNEVLPIPKNKWQNFVHMCDFLASRKCIILPFDTNNNIID